MMGTSISGGSSSNYKLDITEFETVIDIFNYPSGLYSVSLICNGKIQKSKTLEKQ